MDVALLAEVLTAILAVVSFFLGARWRKAKAVLRDLAKALEDTYQALEDDKLTKEELKQLIKDWKKVLENV